METTQAEVSKQWYYESEGQRVGPTTETEMAGLIQAGKLNHGALVWTAGLPDWVTIEETHLRGQLERIAPPPLSGAHVNNTLIWVLAFAPVIGLMLEYLVAFLIHGDTRAGERAMEAGKYWFVTVVLNVALGYLDERALKRAGHDTKRFKGWVWLVPVYLYQRSRHLKQGPAYFIVWIVCFGLVLLD